MSAKKDNLPLQVEDNIDSSGSITYANEVIAIIAGVATAEVEGIAGMCTSGGISDILGRNRNITRGVKVELGTEETSVDLYVIIEYGTPIQKAAQDAQENVRKAIESMTGLHVVRVDVHVQGVSFEKETKELEMGRENAALAASASVLPVTEEAPAAVSEPEVSNFEAAARAIDETEEANEPDEPDEPDEPEESEVSGQEEDGGDEEPAADASEQSDTEEN